MKKLILILFLISTLVLFSLMSCALTKVRDYSVMTYDEWNSIEESRIISLDNITLDGENFWKNIYLDDKNRPLKNRECIIYVLFEERLETDDEEAGLQRLKKYSPEELETSDKIGRIHAKTNKDGWLYIKGLPYDTCFIIAIVSGK